MAKVQLQSGTLYQGDALRVLANLTSESIDAVVTDPPYSSGGAFRSDRQASTRAKYVTSGQKEILPDFEGDSRDQRGYLAWATLWLSECYRLMRPGAPICMFSDWRQLPISTDALQAAGFSWRGIAVWDKTAGVRPAKGRFRAQAEYVLWGSKGAMPPPRSDAPTLPGVFTCAPRKGPRLHQVGKPEPVMAELVRIVPAGGLVLDPFMGSGTTGVAALRAGLGFVGVEMSHGYYQVAVDRLLAEQRRLAAAEGAHG